MELSDDKLSEFKFIEPRKKPLKDVCRECGEKLVIVRGEVICSSCGLVAGRASAPRTAQAAKPRVRAAGGRFKVTENSEPPRSTREALEPEEITLSYTAEGLIRSFRDAKTQWSFKEPVTFEELVATRRLLTNVVVEPIIQVQRVEVTRKPSGIVSRKNEARKLLGHLFIEQKSTVGELDQTFAISKASVYRYMTLLTKTEFLERISRGEYGVLNPEDLTSIQWVDRAFKAIYK